MRSYFLSVAIVLNALVLTGCKSTSPTAKPSTYVLQTRNNSLSLLYQLLGDEQNITKLLIIKRDRRELHAVIKRIAVGSGDAVKTLEQLARKDPTLNLKMTDLPLGEKATRDAETKTTTHDLLHSKGKEFEFQLLLCQAQAMNYATHLAKVAATNEPDTVQRKQLVDISDRLHRSYEEVLTLLNPAHAAHVR